MPSPSPVRPPQRLPHLADRLTQARLAAALEPHTVAHALGVHQATVTNWETGKTEPKASQVVRLAVLYRVAPSDLLLTEPV